MADAGSRGNASQLRAETNPGGAASEFRSAELDAHSLTSTSDSPSPELGKTGQSVLFILVTVKDRQELSDGQELL